MFMAIRKDLREHRMEWVKMWVPALVYTLQMNLLYIGYENVEAAIGQVLLISSAVCLWRHALDSVDHTLTLYMIGHCEDSLNSRFASKLDQLADYLSD